MEGSLKRLRLDRIDVYQLHVPDPVVPLDASIETLANMQAEGKIRLVALSNVTVEHIERARKIVPIVSAIIASAMGSHSSRGSRWEQGAWQASCWNA